MYSEGNGLNQPSRVNPYPRPSGESRRSNATNHQRSPFSGLSTTDVADLAAQLVEEHRRRESDLNDIKRMLNNAKDKADRNKAVRELSKLRKRYQDQTKFTEDLFEDMVDVNQRKVEIRDSCAYCLYQHCGLGHYANHLFTVHGVKLRIRTSNEPMVAQSSLGSAYGSNQSTQRNSHNDPVPSSSGITRSQAVGNIATDNPGAERGERYGRHFMDTEIDPFPQMMVETVIQAEPPPAEATEVAETSTEVEWLFDTQVAVDPPSGRRRSNVADNAQPGPSRVVVEAVPGSTAYARTNLEQPEEEWLKLYARLKKTTEDRRRAIQLESEAFAELDVFLERHGQLGYALAGPFSRRMEHQRSADKAAAVEMRRLEKRYAAEEEQRVQEDIARFERETEEKKAELQQRLMQASRRKEQLGGSPPRREDSRSSSESI